MLGRKPTNHADISESHPAQVNSRIWALEKERMAADSAKMASYVEALHLRRPAVAQVSLVAMRVCCDFSKIC